MTARRHSSGRSTSTRSPEGQHAWPSRSRTSRAPGPRNEYFRVRVEFILWTDDVWLPRMQNHRFLAVAARSGHQSGHGTRVTPASLPGPADGQRSRHPSRSEPNYRASTPPNRVSSIGAPGFEPGTSCSQSRRATGLRHAPYTLRPLVLRHTTVDGSGAVRLPGCMRFAGSLPGHSYARIPTQSGGVSPESGRPSRLPPCYTPLSPTEFPMATPHDARTPRPTEGSHRAHVFNWSPYSHPIASIRERGGQSIPALPSPTDRAGYPPGVRVRHRSLLRRIVPPSLLGSLLPSPLHDRLGR